MPSFSQLEQLCLRFLPAGGPFRLELLANPGGFSDAHIWRVETVGGRFCLRGWPPGEPDEGRLRFIHRVLDAAGEAGLRFVPVPLRTSDGRSFLRYEGRLWELTRWMPGVADYLARPNDQRLAAAMRALASFHQATRSVQQRTGFSPTLQRRADQLRAFWTGPEWRQLSRRVPDGRWPQMDGRALQMLRRLAELRPRLDRALRRPLPPVGLQPVIRDIWHRHVLFVGEQVSGIVDFGSLAVDTVALDLARLLGSLVGNDRRGWEVGLAAYEQVRELEPAERELVWFADLTGVFGGGLTWLREHYLAGRWFKDPAGVLGRVDHFLDRLQGLAAGPDAMGLSATLHAVAAGVAGGGRTRAAP